MEQAGVIHTLAEPNLTAISGESATFVAGGEFPVLNGYTCTAATTGSTASTCQPSIDFKKFGVSLEFHAGRAERRPHQPQGDDGGVGPVDAEFADHHRAGQHQ